MNRILLGTFALLIILVAAERHLQSRREAQRIRDSRLRTLARPQPYTVDRVRRLQIQPAGRTTPWTYRFQDGAWRYPADFGAYAQGDRIDRLLIGIIEGLGTVVSTTSRSDAHYGLTPDRAMVVRLTDTSGVTLQEIWIGRSVPGKDNEESYAKVAGSDTTLHLHANPRHILDWTPASEKPPLIDPYVLPRALPRKSIVRITYRAGRAYPILGLRRVEVAPGRMALPGRLPQAPTFEWRVRFRDGEKTCKTAAAFAYISFLSRLRYERLNDPGAMLSCGFGEAALYIEDEGGTVDTLEVGGKDAQGNTYLHHRSAGLVFALAPEKATLLFPTPSVLLDTLAAESPYK